MVDDSSRTDAPLPRVGQLDPTDAPIDLGLSHVALGVTDLDRSIAFYERWADMGVVHRRVGTDGNGVAWLSDNTRRFVVVLVEVDEVSPTAQLGGVGHLGVAVSSRRTVDERAGAAAASGFTIVGPIDEGPPVGYFAFIVDPDGHNLELSFGQHVDYAIEHPEQPQG